MRLANLFSLVLTCVFANCISLTVQSDDLLVTIGKETTRITLHSSPMDTHHIAALNQQLSKV